MPYRFRITASFLTPLFFRYHLPLISGSHLKLCKLNTQKKTCLFGGLPAEVELTRLLDRVLAAPRHRARPENLEF
jgi:hypothetical protein